MKMTTLKSNQNILFLYHHKTSMESPCGPNEHIVNIWQCSILDVEVEGQCPMLDEQFRDGSVYNSCGNQDPSYCYVASPCWEISVEQQDLDSMVIVNETEKSHQDEDHIHVNFSNLSNALKDVENPTEALSNLASTPQQRDLSSDTLTAPVATKQINVNDPFPCQEKLQWRKE